MTSAEGAQLHLTDLRRRPDDFDPMTRDRFLAGALLPAVAYVAAQRFRAWYRAAVRRLFDHVDVLLAPTTPFPAPRIGQERIMVAGEEVPARTTLGLYTQPLSFIGLPVISVPMARAPGLLPLGVQLVAAPFREAVLLRVAAHLEAEGVVSARIA
jgi:Asp-tRNA(Asn)/Glu-tRNA(Gln) amidotransferase A subunit family amidase